MQAIVLGMREYDFTSDTGERVSGVAIHYITGEIKEDGTRGYLPMRETITKGLSEEIREVPGLYEFEYEMRPGRNSRPSPVLREVRYVGPAKLDTSTTSGAKKAES